ncbi:MAG: aldo/keto reductase [Bacteroidales bacterium]
MTKNSLNRRIFLKTSLLGTAGAVFSKRLLGNDATKPPRDKSDKSLITRKLGNTGIELPIVSFGVMRADNPSLISAALDEGIQHFDTAHGYQNGNNEEMLGEILKDYPRDSFTIATKVPPEEKDRDTGHLLEGSTKKAFLKKLDISLERLQMDYVDILYVHSLSSRQATLFKPMHEALLEAKKQGKARHVGLSTHKNEPEVIEAAIESGVYEVILTSYNFMQDHKDKMKDAIAKAANEGIGIVAMKTMAGGKMDEETDKKVNYKAALKWALRDKNVHTSIPGIINFDELEENMSVMESLELTDDERNFLYAAANEKGLYCNGCETCVSYCRKNIPIPEIMRAYMYAYGYREVKKAKATLAEYQVKENPCTECSVCTVQCVKGFPVSEKIADVTRVTKVPDEFLV